VNSAGQPSVIPAEIDFAVLAPFWRRWCFEALALAGQAFLVLAAHRYRIAQAVKLERMRTRIATDLHDDIGASLSRIAIMSEVLIQRAGSERTGLTTQLSEVARGAREMLASMSDIVWATNPSHDHLRDLSQRMRRFASDVLSVHDIEFTFRAPADQELKMDADTRRQLFLVFKKPSTTLRAIPPVSARRLNWRATVTGWRYEFRTMARD
jgi:signal transduction histidine kinase